MRQILHLLVVDRNTTTALAAWHGARWLLPMLTCAEGVRADPAVFRWVAERGMKGEVVGQWLGRVSPEAADWLTVIRTPSQRSATDVAPAWTPLENLLKATPVMDYQGWAVTTSLARGSQPSVPGPFGSLIWPEEVRTWIGASVGSAPGKLTPYRVTPHEVVLGADTARGRVYFKGLTQERASEARLTQALAALAPLSFARTIALDVRSDGSVWWLTRACPGGCGWQYGEVASSLARLQRHVMASGPVLRELRKIDLGAAVRWASALVDDPACATAMAQAVERVATASIPESWIPMDLDPTNLLVDDGEVRFIDLDDSFFGAAPLAMAVFAKRCRDRSVYGAYEQSWSPQLVGLDWPAFEVVATVFGSWLGWQRVTWNTRRGEVYGALDIARARLRERLARSVIADRSWCQERPADHAV